MSEGKRKRVVISISSDDDEEDSDDSLSDSSRSGYGSNCSDEEDEESDAGQNGEDDESICSRVTHLLQEGMDLDGLNLKECKAYLRRYNLRISGAKAVCILRIQEHWRIRNGNGETLYPRSSFVINCTGDVCKGDVVLFIQRVYKQVDKMKRRGNLQGKRTVAGRVVKESYGAAKQQHTFTVEVLWSKGIQKLRSLFPLLVKGRNLYKLKTFRQRWNNEAERSKVLAEKHKRGAAARHVREMRKTKKTRPADGGVNSQKHFRETIRSQMRETNEAKKGAHGRQKKAKYHGHGHGKPTSHQVTPSSLTNSESSTHQNQTTLYMDRASTHQSLANPPHNPYQSRVRFHNQGAPYHMPSYDLASSPTAMRLPPFRPHGVTLVEPPRQQYQVLDRDHHQAYCNPRYGFESGSSSSYRSNSKPIHPSHLGYDKYGQRNY